ncbi:MAG: hypothetical protein EHM42_01690 [Planctomycetaceae bacterium]|nr:MAG: hypothetical protein EHM42_01690 [Planctomycetaceae bacterium]
MSRRNWLATGLTALGAAAGARAAAAAEGEAAPLKGALNIDSLGKLLKSAGLKGTLREKAYDFTFTEKDVTGEEWNLSMSAVLSNDERTVWTMAWLDELPQSAADVPRTALLRLLADNDMIGNGIFFAYVKSNRRFILQRVVRNENLTVSSFRADLDELAYAVINTYSHWAVKGWKQMTAAPETASASKDSDADEQVKPSAAGVSRTAGKDQGATGRARK